MARPAATSGAPIQERGGSRFSSVPCRRACSRTSRGSASGPRRSASSSRGSLVLVGTRLVSWVTASPFVSASTKTTQKRSGRRSWLSVCVTILSTVAGRKAPASSWESAVSRASRSVARGVGRSEGDSGMILANVRGRLRAQDLRVVATALAGGDVRRREDYERLLLEEGPDRLLDHPGLLEALLAIRTLIVPSPLLFAYVAVRHTLLAAGVIDRDLADYLAALLLEFGDPDRSTRVRRHADLPYYDELVRQGDQLACEHHLAGRYGVAEIYRSAAERFPTLRAAFNRLSDLVFFASATTP